MLPCAFSVAPRGRRSPARPLLLAGDRAFRRSPALGRRRRRSSRRSRYRDGWPTGSAAVLSSARRHFSTRAAKERYTATPSRTASSGCPASTARTADPNSSSARVSCRVTANAVAALGNAVACSNRAKPLPRPVARSDAVPSSSQTRRRSERPRAFGISRRSGRGAGAAAASRPGRRRRRRSGRPAAAARRLPLGLHHRPARRPHLRQEGRPWQLDAEHACARPVRTALRIPSAVPSNVTVPSHRGRHRQTYETPGLRDAPRPSCPGHAACHLCAPSFGGSFPGVRARQPVAA
jgi:hypothetical protein